MKSAAGNAASRVFREEKANTSLFPCSCKSSSHLGRVTPTSVLAFRVLLSPETLQASSDSHHFKYQFVFES